MKTFQSNYKRSRLMKKTNEELLFEILLIVEKVGSFCPEKLMRNGHNRLFEEAYRRFETWDEIVEQCVNYSNKQELTGTVFKTPKEIILEILWLEAERRSLREFDVIGSKPTLHAAAIMFYGSWNRALAIVGLKRYDESLENLE